MLISNIVHWMSIRPTVRYLCDIQHVKAVEFKRGGELGPVVFKICRFPPHKWITVVLSRFSGVKDDR